MLVLQRFTRNLTTLGIIRRTNSSLIADEPRTSHKLEPLEPLKKPTKKKSIVAAAFESLKNNNNQNIIGEDQSNDLIDERIMNSKTVNGILSVTDTNGLISRKHALKVVSILAEWSTVNRVKLSDFENDSRFLKLCRVLGRTVPKNENVNQKLNSAGKNREGYRTDDLNTVLGVAGDDEAAKLIASISLPQMVKVMTTLAIRKRRSTPLLRSLGYNISASSEQLDLKQCADVLFAMSTLSFPDSVLTAKICGDVQAGLHKNTNKSSVVGSILTSLGILKYRDLDILEVLSNWMIKYHDVARSQDLSALFLTLASLNFKSINLDEINSKLGHLLVKEDFSKSTDWLNHVWALTMLRLVDDQHINSVLSAEFIDSLQKDKNGLTPNAKMKLLSINAFAKSIKKNYKQTFLVENSIVYSVPIAHSKTKQILLNGVIDALKSLLSSQQNFVKSLTDSKMGFLIDAECAFDSKRNPIELNKVTADNKRIALMIVDFHDMCHGPSRSLTGPTILSFDLLEKSGYHVVPIPYTEFSTSDKLLKRVQYLDAKFKEINTSPKSK